MNLDQCRQLFGVNNDVINHSLLTHQQVVVEEDESEKVSTAQLVKTDYSKDTIDSQSKPLHSGRKVSKTKDKDSLLKSIDLTKTINNM